MNYCEEKYQDMLADAQQVKKELDQEIIREEVESRTFAEKFNEIKNDLAFDKDLFFEYFEAWYKDNKEKAPDLLEASIDVAYHDQPNVIKLINDKIFELECEL